MPFKYPTEPQNPHGMETLLERFCQSLEVRNYSEDSVIERRQCIGYFIAWAVARGLNQPCEITKPILERYQRFLFNHRKKNGKPLSFYCQRSRLVSLRQWFKWMTKNNHILYNPASEIELPKLGQRLPKYIFTTSEAESVINQPNIQTAEGIRNRAILETLYSTGMRRKELIRLRLYDLDVERGVVMVRQGKGKKDRVIPIGERALAWIDKYVIEVRPMLLSGNPTDALFLNRFGEPFSPDGLSGMVKRCIDAADTPKKGSCHLFRHTMATLMLENGADVRFVQEMLGHASLATTEIYTHVAIEKLKEIHAATHPAARLKRSK